MTTNILQPWDYLDRAAKVHPERAAIGDNKRAIKFAAIHQYSKQMASMLRARGVKPGDFVAVNLPVLTQAVATFAIFHEAAVYVPYIPQLIGHPSITIDWLITTSEIAGIPQHKQIIVKKDWLDVMQRESTTGEPNRYESLDSLCRIAFSSGTTGSRKAIPFSPRQLALRVLKMGGEDNQRPAMMTLMAPRLGVGWNALIQAFVNQTTYLIPGTPMEAFDLLERFNIPQVMGSPYQIAQILTIMRETGRRLPHLHTIQSGGSEIPDDMYSEIEELTNATVLGVLACTEMGWISAWRGRPRERGYVGEIVSDVQVQVVDPETHAPLPEGEVGLLRSRRETMATEYLGNPEATAVAFRDGWFYSGDMARLDGKSIILDGRSSERINVGGVKIDPGRIDDLYKTFPGIDDCAAFSVPGAMGIHEVHLAYVSERDIPDSELAAAFTKELQTVTPSVFH
ncbi:MAG: hypothetical protein RLZZ319_497, partial [Actinomycetota bacterium]